MNVVRLWNKQKKVFVSANQSLQQCKNKNDNIHKFGSTENQMAKRTLTNGGFRWYITEYHIEAKLLIITFKSWKQNTWYH